jgi:hypothetical protein
MLKDVHHCAREGSLIGMIRSGLLFAQFRKRTLSARKVSNSPGNRSSTTTVCRRVIALARTAQVTARMSPTASVVAYR